jgi:hypothetical protein
MIYEGVKAHYSGPKNVIIVIVFENFATFNFHQVNIKRCFRKIYSK